jgi:hypothetical protein
MKSLLLISIVALGLFSCTKDTVSKPVAVTVVSIPVIAINIPADTAFITLSDVTMNGALQVRNYALNASKSDTIGYIRIYSNQQSFYIGSTDEFTIDGKSYLNYSYYGDTKSLTSVTISFK